MNDTPVQDTEVDHAIIHLHLGKGWGKRQIARELDVSRNKVRRVIKKHLARRDGIPHNWEDAVKTTFRKKKIAPWIDDIAKLLEEFPNITAVRVKEELDGSGFDGGMTIVKDAVNALRGKRVKDPVIRFETGPGEQAQMDWTTCNIPMVDGSRRKMKCFSYILAYSRRQYFAFCEREDFFSLIRRHVEAFKYLDGVAHSCLYDNMKTVVLRREGDVPIYNPRFILFATHYGFSPIACFPRRPQTKGKVERPFGYLKGNFLCGRKFRDIEHLKHELRNWMINTADLRNHRTTRKRPLDLWREEQPELIPVPLCHYSTHQVAYRLANVEGFVSWDGNEYSVPASHIGDFVIVKAHENGIEIVSNTFKRLASHELLPPGSGQQTRLPEHVIRHRGRQRQMLDIIRSRFYALFEEATAYAVGLAKNHPRTIRSHLAHILELRQAYKTNDVVEAIRRAQRFQSFDHRVVERILHRIARPRSLEAAIANSGIGTNKSKDTTRKRAEQRNASYYQGIFQRHGSMERSIDDEDDTCDEEDTDMP